MTRGLGQTSQQMRDAPVRALYVVDDLARKYMLGLSLSLGRGDLQVITCSDLESPWIGGVHPSGITLDHAATLSNDIQLFVYNRIKACLIFHPIHQDAW